MELTKHVVDLFVERPFTYAFLVIGLVFAGSSILEFDTGTYFPSFLNSPKFDNLSVGVFFILIAFVVSRFFENVGSRAGVRTLLVGDDGKKIEIKCGLLQDLFVASPSSCIVLPCDDQFSDGCFGNLSSSLGSFLNAKQLLEIAKKERKEKFGEIKEPLEIGESLVFSEDGYNCIVVANSRSKTEPRSALYFTGPALAAIPSSPDGIHFEHALLPILGSGRGNLSKKAALITLLMFAYERLKESDLNRVTIVIFKRADDRPEIASSEISMLLKRVASLLNDVVFQKGN